MGGRTRWFTGTATLGAGQWLDLDTGGVFSSRATYSGTLAEMGRGAVGGQWTTSAVEDREFGAKLASYGAAQWLRMTTDEGRTAWAQVLAERPTSIIRFVTRAEGTGPVLASPDPVFAVGHAEGRIDVHFRADPTFARYRVERRTGPEGVYTPVGEVATSPFADATVHGEDRYGYRITGVVANGDEGIPATVQATTGSRGLIEGVVELDRDEGRNGVDLVTGAIVPSAKADLVLTGTFGGRSGAGFSDGWGRPVNSMEGAGDDIRSPWMGASRSGSVYVEAGRWFALALRGGGVARGRVSFPSDKGGAGREVRVEYAVAPDGNVFPDAARVSATQTAAGIELSIECPAGAQVSEITARVVDGPGEARRLPVKDGHAIDADAPEGRLIEYSAAPTDGFGRALSPGRVVWNGLPRGVQTGTFQFHHRQGWSFERNALASMDEADVYFESAAGGISSITLAASGGIASLDRTIGRDGSVARGKDRKSRQGLRVREHTSRIVAIDPAVLRLERSAHCNDRDPASDVVVIRTRRGGWVKLAIVYREANRAWNENFAAIEYWFNAREPRFVDPGPNETVQNGLVLRPPMTIESFAVPIREGPFSQPHVLMSVRSGAGGGNPNRIDMLGAKTIYVDGVSPEPLVWDPFVDSDEPSRAYVHGSPVPEGKVFVITNVTWRGVAAGDSNGHGEVVVRAGGKELAKWRDDANPKKGTFAGRIFVRPGDESKVNVEVANSSHVEALFEGVLVDQSAAESVPAGAPAKPRSPHETIDTYRRYTDEQLRDLEHEVTLDTLLAIVADDQASQAVRERAAETISLDRVVIHDPGLSMDGRGAHRKRAAFSVRVSKLLSDSDPFVRGLAKRILEELWVGWKPSVRELRDCDPRDKDLCAKAQTAWEKVFGK